MTKLEREYIIPLRKSFEKGPGYKRTNKAVKAVREFIAKHMKSDNIKIGQFLNLELWAKGIKNPPHHVAVVAVRDDEGLVNVELQRVPKVRPKANKRLARMERAEGVKNAAQKVEDEKKSAEREAKKAEIQKKLDEKKKAKTEDKKESAEKKPVAKADDKKSETQKE